MNLSKSDRLIVFDDYVACFDQHKRVCRLMDWFNFPNPDLFSIDDLVIQSFRAGFIRGSITTKAGVNPYEVWKRYVRTQRTLDKYLGEPPLHKITNSITLKEKEENKKTAKAR